VGKLPLSWQPPPQKVWEKPSTFLPERLEEEWRISESQATLTPPPNPLCSTLPPHR